ncbi:uncharacterized protein F4822DRAFT_440855 [Hypoxylon trugodes]|uniref:uncharacterized protein n=1 Tax=Hypoxylon trugodes TaxID=326681 RepID=UPI00219209FF|nr:uncharacterized protein F4822DRAFT_440855 [Hypoxylon trugodes]KAI1382848.1 hypothetical protein F4822DRAFT_440855 [Hypoxylon trugodes]
MSEHSITLHHVVGIAAGIHNGDSITYNYNTGLNSRLSPQKSRVIESIHERRTEKQNPEAIHQLYFYIDYGDEKKKKKFFRSRLATFWEQIAQQDADQSNDFISQCSDNEFWNDLNRRLAAAKRDVYIAIDAIDQLPEADNRNILDELTNLARKHKEAQNKFGLAIVITSRGVPDYPALLAYSPAQIEVDPADNVEDIRKYLEKELASRLFDFRPQLRKRVLRELVNRVDGMFLWAKLQAANIRNMVHEKDVLNALETLKLHNDLKGLYKSYADEFQSLALEPTRKQIALRTIALLGQTTGSMAKETLFVALTLDLRDGKIDKRTFDELQQQPSTVIQTCKHLVEINEDQGIFRFCHESIYGFFSSNQPMFDRGLIAQLCLAHINSPDFSRGSFNDAMWYNWGGLRHLSQQNPFLEFSSCNWPIYFKGLGESHAAFEFLQRLLKKSEGREVKENLQLAFQVHLLTMGSILHSQKERGWLDLSGCDCNGSTAIHWAIRNNIDREKAAHVVERLIEYRADGDIQDIKGRTPLFYASDYGNQHVVECLLQKGVHIDTRSKGGETALIAACMKHHEDIISKLVIAGADVRIQGSTGTSLQAVSSFGCVKCAKLILGRLMAHSTIKTQGVSPAASKVGSSNVRIKFLKGFLDRSKRSPLAEGEGPFGTSLHAAAFHGCLEIVNLLCANGFDVHAKHNVYGSVLTAAVTGCNGTMESDNFYRTTQALINYGVDVNDSSGLYGPALSAAAYFGHKDLASLLLEKGAQVRLAVELMGTAYEVAHEQEHEDVEELLLRYDERAATYCKSDSISTFHGTSQGFQRRMFVLALKQRNRFDERFLQYERIMGNEIENGLSSRLEWMTRLGAGVFNDVIKLATAADVETGTWANSTERRENVEAPMAYGSPSKGVLSGLGVIDPVRVRQAFSNQLPRSAKHKKRWSFAHKFLRGKYGLDSPPSGRQPSVRLEVLEGYFPDVLDRMIHGAVNILEKAILGGNTQIIRLIADSWTDALNNLISLPNIGQPMLEILIRRRLNGFGEHLNNPGPESEERLKRAEGLALVGVELLFTALRRGQTFKYLSRVLSEQWVIAVNGVEESGAQETQVWQFILKFRDTFNKAITSGDRVGSEIYGLVGLEFIGALASSSNRSLLELCSREWASQLTELVKSRMGNLAEKVLDLKGEEYRKCVEDGNYSEAYGLAIAGLCILRAAAERNFAPLLRVFLPVITSSINCLVESKEQQHIRTATSYSQGEWEGLERAFDIVVCIYAAPREV